MLNFAVTNVINDGNIIYVFHRVGEKLCLFKDITFKPYFYQEADNGIFRAINGKRVKKIVCRYPYEVAKKRDNTSYEADVLFYKRYIVDKLGQFLPAKIKYSFIDIEVLCSALPSPEFPNSPISCISVSNNYTKTIKTFYIGNLANTDEIEKEEKVLLNNFVAWIKE